MKKQQNELSGYIHRGIKSLSDLKEFMVKAFTKGNVFLYHDEPNKEELISKSKERAEQLALEMIQRNLEHLPSRIKRDI